MADEIRNGRILWTWKEISAYLDCDQRTANRWERTHSLPIHRLSSGESRSRVYAYQNELDDWLRRCGAKPGKRRRTRPLRLRPALLVLAAAGIVAAAIGWKILRGGWPEPADFAIRGNRIVFLDEGGRELGEYDTGLSNLRDDSFYHKYSQFKRRNQEEGHDLPIILIKDLDGDGRREILFTTQTQDEMKEGKLLCFDGRGHKLWEFAAGRAITYGLNKHTAAYRIHGIDATDLDGDGRSEILCIARHRLHAPNQTVLLDADGSVTGEYWNYGYLLNYEFVDLDRDGIREIVLVGTNNEYNRGVLVALDPRRMRGGSPQTPAARSPDLTPGTEKFYVLFPVADVEEMEPPSRTIDVVAVMEDGILTTRSRLAPIYYNLDFSLRVRTVQNSSIFEIKHKAAREAGGIDSVLGVDYLEALKPEFRYWTGKGWSAEPTGTAAWN